MTYKTRTVRCSKAGLTQEQALESLYDHPEFDPANMQVVGIRQAGNHWVAKLRVAEFPPVPDDSDNDDSPAPEEKAPKPKAKPEADGEGPDLADSSDDDGDDGLEGDGPPPKKEEGPGGSKGGEGGELSALLHLVHQIADHLGIGGDGLGLPGSEDPSLPGPGAPPPGPLGGPPPHKPPAPPAPGGPPGAPHGGPPGLGGPPGKPPLPIRPGEVPPGVTPINTPAFSSVQIVGKVPSFTASEETNVSLREAKAELEALYGPGGSDLPGGARPYRVAQMKEAKTSAGQRVVHALLVAQK